jgi:hypothetical protein
MTPQQGREQAADKNAIRPFHVNVPEAELTELRRRINATRWPERETVTDQSQGVQLGTVQTLARLLGERIRLAQVRGKIAVPAELPH